MMRQLLPIAVLSLAVTTACSNEGSSSPEAASRASWDGELAHQVAQKVTVVGEFAGSNPQPHCAFAPTTRPSARSRTDWLLLKDGHCVWIARGVSIFGKPEAILAPASIGRRVEVTAKVAVDDEKRVYLEFVDGHPL